MTTISSKVMAIVWDDVLYIVKDGKLIPKTSKEKECAPVEPDTHSK